jgi:glycosyltransferase involved in cell wall biosynthesis
MRPRYLLQQATWIIAVSKATKDDLIRLYGIKAEKISVVPSGVADRKMPTGDPKIPGLAAKTESDAQSKEVSVWPQRFILYLGTLEPRKNIVSIIEGFTACAHKIPQDLVIAGEKGWLGRRVRQAVEKSTVSGRIHQIGCVTEEEKWQLYEKADLFIYPSFYEGFGFPPLEAIVAGTPAVIANNSSLPEVAGDFATMINPYDVAELALVIEELLKNPEVVPVETIEKIKKQYAWTETARQTLLVLKTAARAIK